MGLLPDAAERKLLPNSGSSLQQALDVIDKHVVSVATKIALRIADLVKADIRRSDAGGEPYYLSRFADIPGLTELLKLGQGEAIALSIEKRFCEDTEYVVVAMHAADNWYIAVTWPEDSEQS